MVVIVLVSLRFEQQIYWVKMCRCSDDSVVVWVQLDTCGKVWVGLCGQCYDCCAGNEKEEERAARRISNVHKEVGGWSWGVFRPPA